MKNKNNDKQIANEIHAEVNATDLDAAIAELRSNQPARGTRAKNKNYTFGLGDTNVKMSPQAILIIEAIAKIGKSPVSEQEIFDAVEACDLKTKQTKWKVYQFYRPAIIAAGWLVRV